ncbi:hypothetical protein [Streptomyces sp. NPDC018972]|uniref:hypothetical protein n=1 Tax=Streptomyces sp. NPDC018972 TaxID=3365060 RepID=UPI0037B11EA9
MRYGTAAAASPAKAVVLRPAGTKAVDAALLLAEMAVPHPARPTRPGALRLAHAPLPQLQRLMGLDERLQGMAARPVVVPETIVVNRGKVYLSAASPAACGTLGISVQPTPPHSPTAKGIVERTFGTIDALLCRHLPGYTGSDVTRCGPAAETGACFSVTQLQDLLDERLVHYHHRPHEGLCHPTSCPLCPYVRKGNWKDLSDLPESAENGGGRSANPPGRTADDSAAHSGLAVDA